MNDSASRQTSADDLLLRPRRSLASQAVRRLRQSVGAMVGLGILMVIILCAIFADWLAPYPPLEMNPADMLQGPSLQHLFGTDKFGRDLFSRVLHGSRISLRVGLISVALAAVGGGLVGLVAGYTGGVVEMLVMRITDAMLAFPGLLLSLAIVAALGPSLVNVMIAVGVSWSPSYVRLVRGSVLSAKQNLYVDAAYSIGAGSMRIMFVHLLPNVFAPVLVLSTLGVAGSIITAASLSYLGMGAQPPTPEWGLMLSQGRSLLQIAWWITTFPGMVIMLTVLAINLVGDGLRDALDPRLKI